MKWTRFLKFEGRTIGFGIIALIALGYKPQEASRMVAAVNDDSVIDSEELIRRALKSVVKT